MRSLYALDKYYRALDNINKHLIIRMSFISTSYNGYEGERIRLSKIQLLIARVSVLMVFGQGGKVGHGMTTPSESSLPNMRRDECKFAFAISH